MSVVTFKEAAALKASGFSQPLPNEEQFWYNPKTERLCVVMWNNHGWQFRVSYFGSAKSKGGWLDDSFVYCPSKEEAAQFREK